MPLPCYSWGTTDQERLLDFPCDTVLDRFDDTYHRGVTIEASPEIVFKWICQLRVANYVHGRGNSPGLIPGMDELAVGQPILGFFEIQSFDYGRHLTMCTKKGSRESKFHGDIAVSYMIVPEGESRCRLLVRYRIKYPAMSGVLLRLVLPWGDLFMMRRQLGNFKRLSEQTERGR